MVWVMLVVGIIAALALAAGSWLAAIRASLPKGAEISDQIEYERTHHVRRTRPPRNPRR